MSRPAELVREPARHVQDFDVHGVAIEVRTDSPEVAATVARRLRPFDPADGAAAVVFEVVHDPDLAPLGRPAGGRPVYDTELGDVWYVDDDDRLVVDCGGVQVDARPTEGVVATRYAAATDELLSLAAHPLFTLPLLEVMKRRGRFPLHASCVSRHGRGVLFPGPSGSGKSTISVALARAGADFVSDDMVFLWAGDADGVGSRRAPAAPSSGAGAIEVRGFADEVDLTDDSAARFPELAHLVGQPTWGARPKHQVRLEDVIGGAPAPSCRPSFLLFPHLRAGEETAFEELGRDDALMELLPNVLLTEADSTQRHLDQLALLVNRTPAFRLVVGTDVDAAVAAIVARTGLTS